jgi:hypothetical protein
MRYIVICICLFWSISGIGQKKKVLKKVEADLTKELGQWYLGNVQFWADDSKISGLLQFNDKTRLLTFKLEDSQSEILRPNEVKGFDFFDEENNITRSFVSIRYPVIESYTNEKTFRHYFSKAYEGRTIPEFLEISKQTKSFAFVSKTNAAQLIQKNSGQIISPDIKRFEFGQEITFFFYDLKERLYPAIRLTKIETKKSTKNAENMYYFFGSVSYSKNSNIDLDVQLLSEIMNRYFPKVREYMNANKLDRNNIEDLMKIIEYYKQLEDQE